MKTINNHFLDYADAVCQTDIAKISHFFHAQFMLSTPNDCWYLSNDDTFRKNLRTSFLNYKNLAADICKMLALEITNFQSNHCMAHIEWGLLNKQQHVIVKFDISYCVKLIEQNWKFIFVIDHNEMERIEEYQRTLNFVE